MRCLQVRNCQEYAELFVMHELRIAEDLSAIVLETAGRASLNKVTGVNISFGQLIQIVPDIFESAFRECVRGTIAGNSELVLEIVPVKMRCTNCGNDFKVEENVFKCNKCGSVDLTILQGKELFIKSIEGE